MSEIIKTEGTFEGWCILELMGRRKLGGWLSEQTIAGVGFIRIDVCGVDGKPIATQQYNPAAVYCITPTTQAIAIQYGAAHKPEPVTRWEMPGLKAMENSSTTLAEYFGGDENEDEEEYL